MAGDWRLSTWGDEISLEYGKALRGYDETSGKYRVFGSNGPIGWTAEEPLAPGPGVILGRKGAYRGVHYSRDPFFVIDTAYFVVPKRELDMRWLYYAMKHYKLGDVDDGSPIPSTTRAAVYVLELDVPPLHDQRTIAEVLGTLDDKIELNQQRNEMLEAMARALFKSWFVDFTPVRAKAEGENPGLPKPIADLFPDSLQDSPLGDIPMGWRVESIGDLAEVVGGSTPSTTNPSYWEGGPHSWVTPRDLSRLSIPVLLDTERRITDAGLSQIGSGLLPPGVVLLSSRAPIGYVAITEIPVAINQGFIAMQPKVGVSNLFLLFWSGAAHDAIVSRANGSTFLEISKANFRPIPVVIPPASIMRAFDDRVRLLFDRIVLAARESLTLAALRDALLPKLITGDVLVGRN
ncbi:MAG TPA: restriction endonuclease subunit S [Gemmatimonadaceae bacterium]|nr:restriction endonuclease subunit S [Gemmatimonadaceae bacterium]